MFCDRESVELVLIIATDIAGGFDGSVTLWQFGFEVPLCAYK